MSRLRGISCTISDKEIDELEFDSLDIDDDGSSQTVQTDKRKNRSSDNDEAAKKAHALRPGLEEASGSSNSALHRTDVDKEERFGQQDECSSFPLSWRASANAVKASADLSELSTFQETASGPYQLH